MNFLNKTPVSKQTVLQIFSLHEKGRDPSDDFALRIIDNLFADNTLKYYKVDMTEKEILNIILPRHNHGINFIPEMGLDIITCCKRYQERFEQYHRKDCFNKIIGLKNAISQEKLSNEAGFILLSNNKDLAHPENHYEHHSKEKLFIANGFHRLMAIGLIFITTGHIMKNNFYYGETSNVA